MATYDLIGLPFPKSEPLFLEDTALQRKLRQAEDLIEIYHEFGVLRQQVDGLLALQSEEKLLPFGVYGPYVAEAMACGCIVAYGKSFSSSSRLMLDSTTIYRGTDLAEAHDFFMRLRNKLYAHQEYVGNQHQMFVFPSSKERGPKLNPFGQHNSVLISSGVDWATFKECVEICREHTKRRITEVCDSIEQNFSQEQVIFIDSCDRSEALEKYWQLSPSNRRDPLEPR